MKKNREWINKLDLSKLKLYPLQFANVERINNNNAVFIFDEVGTGKTISAGIMALEYLEKNPKKKALIITTNSLSGSKDYEGQFLSDWYEKLPFKDLEYENRIRLINNFYSNIQKETHNNWGIVIIDEAHLFLNKYSERYKALCNIHADKVIFMTASPIKDSTLDLYIYSDIAKSILREKYDDDITKELICKNLSCEGKDEKEIISSIFNPKIPVTRYFKDTVISINNEGNFKEPNRKRLTPHLWQYKGDKNRALLNNIEKVLKDSPDSHFVVFTRFIKKEACLIGEFFKENGYICSKSSDDNKKTYYIVTGENREELSYFSRVSNLPTVLILTCQIAEQGINLPGFNYVVNYNIPAYPSSLEQRFGRIDRMGSNGNCYSEINMSFLISENIWDTNKANFYQAVATYINSMISYIPSKNTILDENIINKYIDEIHSINIYLDNIRKLIKCDNEINELIEYYRENETISNNSCELSDFCESHNIDILSIINSFSEEGIIQTKEEIRKIINGEIDNLENFSVSDEKISFAKKIVKLTANKVFYSKDDEFSWIYNNKHILTVEAVEMGKYILNDNVFKDYCEEFKENIKIPLIFNEYKEDYEKIFEDIFIKNKNVQACIDGDFKEIEMFDVLFSKDYRKILLLEKDVPKEKYSLLKPHLNELIPTLPFFKLCRKFKYIIQERICLNEEGYLYQRYNFNPLTRAIRELLSEYSLNDFDLTEEFKKLYEYNINKKYMYLTKEVDENRYIIVNASNWLKLFYWYSRIEEVAFYHDNCKSGMKWHKGEDNYYQMREWWEKEKEIVKGEDKELENMHNEIINQITELIDKLGNHYSLFYEFYRTNTRKVRKNIPYTFHKKYWKKGKFYDKLTKEIIESS